MIYIFFLLGLTENRIAFKEHFDQLEKKYDNIEKLLLINLVEETGKESILGDAYVEQLSELNNEKFFYVQFDFHEHWYFWQFFHFSHF